ncbi:PFS domain-containing protein [Fusarium napiforme]|uniref:PFS domain-containing protein n=1 Tax=Fusarium napiforme TaxID=42672 RepID=A0A8H5IHW7_9HYPO|nr:PFS domain-containing protein [Fusarium napiforme]
MFSAFFHNLTFAPSNIQYEASGSEVSKVESDIAQTVNLADTVVNLIREPVVLLYQNISKKRALHASLGIWRDEAPDDAGQYRIPVMLENGLEAQLVRTDGIIDCRSSNTTSLVPQERRMFRLSWGRKGNSSQVQKPQTPPLGSACWAYFLHSLGVRPGMNVLGWRPSTDGYISTQNGGVEMEIDGSALCHIINLYAKLPEGDCWGERPIRIRPDLGVPKSCTFPSGKLAWEAVNDQLHAHFTPGVEAHLNTAKQPFREQGNFMEPNTMMISYLTALRYGVGSAVSPPTTQCNAEKTCYDTGEMSSIA